MSVLNRLLCLAFVGVISLAYADTQQLVDLLGTPYPPSQREDVIKCYLSPRGEQVPFPRIAAGFLSSSGETNDFGHSCDDGFTSKTLLLLENARKECATVMPEEAIILVHPPLRITMVEQILCLYPDKYFLLLKPAVQVEIPQTLSFVSTDRRLVLSLFAAVELKSYTFLVFRESHYSINPAANISEFFTIVARFSETQQQVRLDGVWPIVQGDQFILRD